MAGMRATSRAAVPNPKAEQLLRACMDLVEHLVRQSLDVTTAEVETTLSVVENAYNEMEAEVGAANAADGRPRRTPSAASGRSASRSKPSSFGPLIVRVDSCKLSPLR